jgi:hypothetical protein
MKSPRAQRLGLGNGHRSQKSGRSTTTEAASRDPRWDILVIAATHPVFISVARDFTGAQPRACGGPAIMIMHPANSGAGIHSIGGIGDLPVTTGTEETFQRSVAKLLTKDEARWIAANVAKLPELASLKCSVSGKVLEAPVYAKRPRHDVLVVK